jgi:hypothetical protein
MNSDNVTLGDFVQQLLLQMGELNLSFKDERPWHELFYRLKRGPEQAGKPNFLRDLFFDWNGEYPKCRELGEYLHALHWTGCMEAANPDYEGFKLDQRVGELWQTDVDPNLQHFIMQAAEVARQDLAA